MNKTNTTTTRRAAAAAAAAGRDADAAAERAALTTARKAVDAGTATPLQTALVADSDAARAGARSRAVETARDLLTTVETFRAEGIALPTSDAWTAAHRAALALVADADAPRKMTTAVLDAEGNRTGDERVAYVPARRAIVAADPSRMTVDALRALTFRAAISAVGTERRYGWRIDARRVQDVTADVAASLVAAVLADAAEGRAALVADVGRRYIVEGYGKAPQAAYVDAAYLLNTATLPRWTDAPEIVAPERDEREAPAERAASRTTFKTTGREARKRVEVPTDVATSTLPENERGALDVQRDTAPRERWTRHLLRLAGPLVTDARRLDEIGADRDRTKRDAATLAQKNADAERMAELIDAAGNALPAPYTAAERRALLAAVDGRDSAERAAALGTKAGATRVQETRGRDALKKRYPSADALAADAERVAEALDAERAAAERALTADVVKRAGWSAERVALNTAIGKAHAVAATVAAEQCERGYVGSNRRLARVTVATDAAERAATGRPADVLRYVDHLERVQDERDALTHRATVRAALRPSGCALDVSAAVSVPSAGPSMAERRDVAARRLKRAETAAAETATRTAAAVAARKMTADTAATLRRLADERVETARAAVASLAPSGTDGYGRRAVYAGSVTVA